MAHKVLCPIDFTDSSRDALRAAIPLATGGDAIVALVHVWQAPPGYGPQTSQQVTLFAESRARAQQELGNWRDDALELGAKHVEIALLSGSPWREIVELANKDPEVHVIVMGTHGRTGLEHLVLGSVAERVVRHAPCSVLVVRPPRTGNTA